MNWHCLKVPSTDAQITPSLSERCGGISTVDATLNQLTTHHLNQKSSIFLNTSCHKNIGVVCFLKAEIGLIHKQLAAIVTPLVQSSHGCV